MSAGQHMKLSSSEEAASDVAIFQNFSTAQWLTTGAGLLLLLLCLLLNCVLKNRRWRSIQEARSGLITAEFLTLQDLPRHAYALIANEAIKERKLKITPKWRDDCGWGAPGTQFDGVHFRTFIASSLHILEKFATQKDPKLVACPQRPPEDFSKSYLACDVDDYLLRIRESLKGGLDADLCNQYLAFFRNARTPGKEVPEQEFRAFLGVFQEILRRLEE